jgi:hypothetical protein
MATPEQIALLNDFQGQSIEAMQRYLQGLQAGRVRYGDYQRLVVEELRGVYLASAWAARGTTDLTAQDYGRSGPQLKNQYKFLGKLFEQAAAGQISAEELQARLGMYVRSSTQQFAATEAGTFGIPTLPHYPSDGSTECLSNCNCSLSYHQHELGWDIEWNLGSGDTCPTCRRRAAAGPLRVRYNQVTNPEIW